MNNEIKEILDRIETASEIFDCLLKPEECSLLLDYITNLQQEIQEANDSITWWTNRFKAVERENERLKEELNCKEYFSSIMPEDTEFVILTKNNYDRQQKDIQLELIDYKSRCEKASEELQLGIDSYNNGSRTGLFECIRISRDILQNGSDEM